MGKYEKEYTTGSVAADILTGGIFGLSDNTKCEIKDSETGKTVATGYGDSKTSAEKAADKNLNSSKGWW